MYIKKYKNSLKLKLNCIRKILSTQVNSICMECINYFNLIFLLDLKKKLMT